MGGGPNPGICWAEGELTEEPGGQQGTVISYMYTHFLFFRFSSHLSHTEHRVEFPVLYSRFSLVMYFMRVCCLLSRFSRVRLFTTLWTVARQAPLSMGFSRQEYQSGLSFPPPGYLPDPGMEPVSLSLLHWQAGSSPLAPLIVMYICQPLSPNSFHPSLFPLASIFLFSVSVSLFLLCR